MAPAKAKLQIPIPLETTSMFKKLVPVIALALLAGPVFAADAPAADQSAASAKSSSHSKHHSKKHSKSSAASPSSAPAPAKQ